MKQVRVIRIEGERRDSIVSMPDHRAMTYVRNGQAEPVGWDPNEAAARPTNRMLDTSRTSTPKESKPKDSDDGQ